MRLEELGERIREARTKLGMTQQDIAGALQVTPQAVSKWERGENAPDITIVPDLARLLDVSADRLLGTNTPEERTIDATVCFSDIAGFTNRVEKLSPEEVATIMNAHYLQITEVTLQFGGVPVKYIGDSSLYFFAGPEHRLRAIHAALRTVKIVSERIGIGMSSGPIYIGKLGHPDYASLDIMGDVVNLAARTGNWAGKTESRIAATGDTVDSIEDQLITGRSEEREVKGFDRMMRLIEITGIR
jgi:class 3 adenylate cyclase